MPTVEIVRYEAEDDLLPHVCMKCGEPATIRVTKKFSWYPRWIPALIFLGLPGLLAAAIISANLTKRMTVQAPMCDQHRKHWSNYLWVTLGGFLLMLAAGTAMTFVGIAIANAGPRSSDTGGLVIFFSWLGSLLAWLIALVIASNRVIRPTEITDRHMTLKGVADPFVDALWKERDAAEDAHESERPRRGERPAERDNDPRPIPRRSTGDDRIQS